MIVNEETVKINISKGKVSKKLPVFYNPVMKLNRDITILLLNCVSNNNMQIALPLAGSGVRGLRLLKELKKGKIKSICLNDYKTSEKIKENLKLNKVNADVYNKEANLFLLESKGFDYIDIDPFGTPNPYLDSSIVRLARNGILAVTATDTSALAGSHPKACIRKYWAVPLKNELMHEIGIRILIRKVQLTGAQYEKALTPIFSYFKDYYYRIFFKCDKGKSRVDNLLKFHKYLVYNPKNMERTVSDFINKKGNCAGPLWIGKLWDKRLVRRMFKECNKHNKKLYELLSIIKDECTIDTIGFYDLHKYAKLYKKQIPKIESILSKDISRTHFLGWGVRCKKLSYKSSRVAH